MIAIIWYDLKIKRTRGAEPLNLIARGDRKWGRDEAYGIIIFGLHVANEMKFKSRMRLV